MFKELKDLEVGSQVFISIVPDEEVAICEVIELSKKIIVVKSSKSNSRHPWWREFVRESGINTSGEKHGKILQEYEIAIKEVGVKCPYCGISQRNFFMACEFLQGGKNLNCFYCGKFLWLSVDGSTKKVTADR